MKKILIATTNIGKFTEMTAELADLHFQFINLKDAGLDKFEAEEPHAATWQNALEKAKFFGKKSGLLTIAEDTGLFVNYLKGAPSIKSKRYAPTAMERSQKILKMLKNAPKNKRTAYFESSGCIYDPRTENFSIFVGRVRGLISKTVSREAREGMGYDSIFYYPPLKKTFAQLPLLEKNRVSHRGKMILQIKYHLMKCNSFKQIIASVSVVVKNRKMLMTKRRDLRVEFNNKWEFPGGGVEAGESIVECLKRETMEETGYSIVPLEQLPEIFTASQREGNYQVHLFIYICKIKSGKFKPADAETCGHGWFTYKEALKIDMLPLNKKSIQSKLNKKVLKKYID